LRAASRAAIAFASLPASGGLVLLVSAALAVLCANTWVEPYYRALRVGFVIAPGKLRPVIDHRRMALGRPVSDRFLTIALGIRRELTEDVWPTGEAPSCQSGAVEQRPLPAKRIEFA
jgi:Na+/H+ antiporter NhaA